MEGNKSLAPWESQTVPSENHNGHKDSVIYLLSKNRHRSFILFLLKIALP